MQQEMEIPDIERVDELDELLDDVTAAINHIPSADSAEMWSEDIDTAYEALTHVETQVREEKNSIPEWDEEFVRDLISYNAQKNDVNLRSESGHLIMTFDVGPYGEETTFRYEKSITRSDTWVHQKVDGEWVEVWSKK